MRDREWHRWFAWHPVLLSVGDETCWAWLETIERRRVQSFGSMLWDYRDNSEAA